MESIENDTTKYKKHLEECINIYKQVHHIMLISLNDVFMNDQFNLLKNDELIKDTIDILTQNEYNLDKILNSNLSSSKENKFIKLSFELDKVINSPIIEKYSSETTTITKNKIKVKKKKSYEVDILSTYMVDILESNNINNIIEMGCGKSYLTDSILLNDSMIYFGIDKKDDLIEKSKKSKTKKENSIVLNYNVTNDNYKYLYESDIEPLLKSPKDKVLLFGLHSCGNLTSNTLKMFVDNSCFTHIVIIGCCLNLLMEYITPETKESDLFKLYIQSIGYDNKGNFLEQSLLYEYNFSSIGFPLSRYIIEEHPRIFLGRTARNSAMQNSPKNEDKIINVKQNISYKKLFYRTLLQAFFESNYEEMKLVYGFGKMNINISDDFSIYLNVVFENIEKILLKNNCDDNKDKYAKFCEFRNGINKDLINQFYSKWEIYENIVWAVYIIRLKFAKLIEYLIALDRVIYLQENNVKNVKLVKIFEESMSVRNILIYASK